MTASPPVSVVVVSWNTRDLLARCLDSLAISHSAGLAHVVVVDNASSDGSAELVRERYQWAELVATQENLGFGTAVNVGARASDSPWIAAANADIELSEDTLGELLQAGARWPRCGVLAPRLVQSDDYVQGSVFAFPRLWTILLASTGFFALSPRLASRMHSGRWDPEREAEVEWALGAFLMLRRDAFEAVGGFDERLWMYAEDLDLCWRLRRAAGRPFTFRAPRSATSGVPRLRKLSGPRVVPRRCWRPATAGLPVGAECRRLSHSASSPVPGLPLAWPSTPLELYFASRVARTGCAGIGHGLR